MIREELKHYIVENIFPEYEKNDEGHALDHILYVVRRSLNFAKTVSDINEEMVYVVACYHDIGYHIDKETHEKISADVLLQDKKLKEFFTEEEIKTMADAICDHRSSFDGVPRNIYGKIVSSADRNTSIDQPFQRTYAYLKKRFPDASLEDVIEMSRKHLIEKFDLDGYACSKIYFDDKEYSLFLEELRHFLHDKVAFVDKYKKVNKLD